jgi:hypothetical protein
MIFVVASFITMISFKRGIRQFHRTDIGIVQRYIDALLVALVLFNDPLCFFFMSNRHILYACYQSVVESLFIALLFFFWLLLLHSIAQSENIITIGWKQFYFPKLIVCGALLSYLVTMRIYVYIRYSQDPFFEFLLAVEHMDTMYKYLQSFGITVITLYSVYFCMILSRAVIVIKNLKKSYRYSMVLTLFTMMVSMVLMYNNGQASQRMSPPLFLSLLTLFNFYVILIAHLYTPIMGDEAASLGVHNYDIPAAEKERRQIMNAFYETELKNEDDGEETNRSRNYDEETDSLAKGQTSHRRDIKRPSKDKAKDRLWESIV